jgi:hypothetical protein
MKYRLAFFDSFTGADAGEDMGVAYGSAEEAQAFAEATWADAQADLPPEGAPTALTWDGPVGTATYRMSFGSPAVTTFTVRYFVTYA